MYDYLNGKLATVTPTNAVVDCNGVGYSVHVSLHTYSQLKDKQTVKIFTHLIVREDAQELFGFADEDERAMFRHLIGVSGVGASTARMILSSLNPIELKHKISSADVNALQKVKGIGNKTAQRIIIDLKDKMHKVELVTTTNFASHNTTRDEALSALLTLGFARNTADKALEHASRNKNTEMSVEEWIKSALALL